MYSFSERLRMFLIKIPWINNYINPVILEGDEMILLDCEKTKFPEHYNEGVFAWMENRKICTTLEYHESKGGDPEVLHAWLERWNHCGQHHNDGPLNTSIKVSVKNFNPNECKHA